VGVERREKPARIDDSACFFLCSTVQAREARA